MRDRRNILILGIALGLLTIGNTADISEIGQHEWEREEMEVFLKTAHIISIDKDQEAGRTSPWEIMLQVDDKTEKGFFKHVDRRRPGFLADSYIYELAAYELDRMLDANMVPPVVNRQVESIDGSLQLFVAGCMRESDRSRRSLSPPDEVQFEDMKKEISIFEHLTYCVPNDPDDVLIQKECWKIWRVDFSQAFVPEHNLIPDLPVLRCSRKLWRNLKALDESEVRSRLAVFLNPREIEAVLDRRLRLIEKIQAIIEQKGEDAVLFM